MTIREALDQRIPRIRRPNWVNPNAYLRLPLLANGGVGPWAELYDVESQTAIGIKPGSQRICVFLDETDGYMKYTGPVSDWERAEGSYAKVYAEE